MKEVYILSAIKLNGSLKGHDQMLFIQETLEEELNQFKIFNVGWILWEILL